MNIKSYIDVLRTYCMWSCFFEVGVEDWVACQGLSPSHGEVEATASVHAASGHLAIGKCFTFSSPG